MGCTWPYLWYNLIISLVGISPYCSHQKFFRYLLYGLCTCKIEFLLFSRKGLKICVLMLDNISNRQLMRKRFRQLQKREMQKWFLHNRYEAPPAVNPRWLAEEGRNGIVMLRTTTTTIILPQWQDRPEKTRIVNERETENLLLGSMFIQ